MVVPVPSLAVAGNKKGAYFFLQTAIARDSRPGARLRLSLPHCSLTRWVARPCCVSAAAERANILPPYNSPPLSTG